MKRKTRGENERKPRFQIDYNPHPSQLEIHNDPSRFRVAVCGRKFGKTTMAVAELIFNALFRHPGSINWYIAPTYRQAKNIAWRQKLLKMIPHELIVRKHEMELSLTLFNDSIIELKGTDNPDSLRGVDIDLCILDEYAYMKPYVWEEIIRPNLTATQGEAIFIGTPAGYNHFWDIFQMGKAADESYDTDYHSFQKPSSENPYLPEGEIEKAEKELSDNAFAQEYLADFRANVGKVYPEFDRQVHVIAPFDIPSDWTWGRYLDRGWRVPTGVGFCVVDPQDTLYIIDEIYETHLTNPQLSAIVEGKSTNRYFWHSWGDSAQASDLADLANLGVHFEPVKKQPGEMRGEWIKSGIQKVAERLKVQAGSGKPKLFVFSNCKKHIFEFENYEWDDKKGEDPIERPKKKHNHLMDGLRYFLLEFRKAPDYETPQAERPKNWSLR